jgi:hypothetical protein
LSASTLTLPVSYTLRMLSMRMIVPLLFIDSSFVT